MAAVGVFSSRNLILMIVNRLNLILMIVNRLYGTLVLEIGSVSHKN